VSQNSASSEGRAAFLVSHAVIPVDQRWSGRPLSAMRLVTLKDTPMPLHGSLHLERGQYERAGA
jgi:hypothetical protein